MDAPSLPVTGKIIALFIIHVSDVLSLPIVCYRRSGYAFPSPQTLRVVQLRSSCVFEFRLETRNSYRPIKVFHKNIDSFENQYEINIA